MAWLRTAAPGHRLRPGPGSFSADDLHLAAGPPKCNWPPQAVFLLRRRMDGVRRRPCWPSWELRRAHPLHPVVAAQRAARGPGRGEDRTLTRSRGWRILPGAARLQFSPSPGYRRPRPAGDADGWDISGLPFEQIHFDGSEPPPTDRSASRIPPQGKRKTLTGIRNHLAAVACHGYSAGGCATDVFRLEGFGAVCRGAPLL